MPKTDIILIFDIGKTNKKVLLFNRHLKIIKEEEIQFPEIIDDDGFPCDDIINIEKWIDKTLVKFVEDRAYNVAAVNFTTYGATLGFLDSQGRRITPVYNYLKPMPAGTVEPLYAKYGGENEFSRRTASPALGMLNSGLQILWLKKHKTDAFNTVKNILHFPQYLSFRHTGKIVSEHTSLGCHTAMWDFDRMEYHQWLHDEGINLPAPISTDTVYETNISGKSIKTGIGIHDSSASLVPYLKGSNDDFILLSTGTWCINMNPFNHSPLTSFQLENDSLCYMSVNQKPVKSSRVFLGHIHDVNTERLCKVFKVDNNYYKNIKPDKELLNKLHNANNPDAEFFRNGVPVNYIDLSVNKSSFSNFTEAYHRLMIDLTDLAIKSINLVVEKNDKINSIYIAGGFARNELFTRLLVEKFADKKVYTSKIDNSTSLGAALVVYKHFGYKAEPLFDLGLKEIRPL